MTVAVETMQAPVPQGFSAKAPSFSDSFSSPSFDSSKSTSDQFEFAPIDTSHFRDITPNTFNDTVTPVGHNLFRDTVKLLQNPQVSIFEIPSTRPVADSKAIGPFGKPEERHVEQYPYVQQPNVIEYFEDLEAPEAIGNLATATIPFADSEPANELVNFQQTELLPFQEMEPSKDLDVSSEANAGNEPHLANTYARKQYDQAVATLAAMEEAGFERDPSVDILSQILVDQAVEEGFVREKALETQEVPTQEVAISEEEDLPVGYFVDEAANANRIEALMQAWGRSNTGNQIANSIPLAIEQPPEFTSEIVKDVEGNPTQPDGSYHATREQLKALGTLPETEGEAEQLFVDLVQQNTAVESGTIFQAKSATDEEVNIVRSPVVSSLFF